MADAVFHLKTNMTEGGKMTAKYAAVQFFFWMLLGDITGFSSVFLLARGFSNVQIGALLAFGGGISVFLQPLIAGFADSHQRLSVKTFILGFCAIQILLSLYLFGMRPGSAGTIAVSYSVMIIAVQVMNPLVSALGTECINQGVNLNFGIARGIGSVGYAALSYSLGMILAVTGTDMQPFSISVISVILSISIFFFPFSGRKNGSEKEEGAGRINPFHFFARYRRFGIMLIGCVLIYTGHMVINNFAYQIVVSKGGTSREMGIAMAIAAMCEMPVLFLFSRMLKIAGCGKWMKIAGIAFTLKAIGTLLAGDMMAYYLVQVIQMMGWGVMTVASVYFVNLVMEKQDAVKGQAYMTMTYTAGSVLGSVLGGKIIDISGVDSAVMFASAAAFLGMLIMMFTIEKEK